MAIYLLHFDRPLDGGQRPQHYLGWTNKPVEDRFQDHVTGQKSAQPGS